MPNTQRATSAKQKSQTTAPRRTGASQPSSTGVPDDVYALVSITYHALQGAENYGDYVQDAQDADDREVGAFFEECRDEEVRRAQRALQLLATRVSSEGVDDAEDDEDEEER
jgi:hypothetical protein